MIFTNINKQFGEEKKTRIILSIEQNNIKEFTKLINDKKIDIELGDALNRTPLMYAFFCGRSEMINILLQKGASLDHADKLGKTLFYYYAELSKIDVLQILLTLKADPNKYVYPAEMHCFNCMLEEPLQKIFSIIPERVLTNIIKADKFNDKVKAQYIKLLAINKNYHKLKEFFWELKYDIDHIEGMSISDLEILVYESLPEEYTTIEMLNKVIVNYLQHRRYPEISKLLSKGADFNLILEKLYSSCIGICFWFKGNKNSSELLKSDEWNEMVDYFDINNAVEPLKKLLTFTITLSDYDSNKYNRFKYEKNSKTEAYRKALKKIVSILVKFEFDPELMKYAYFYLDKGEAKNMIRQGLIPYNESDRELLNYFFKFKKFDDIPLSYKESYDYVNYLKDKADYANLIKLYWEVEDNELKGRICDILGANLPEKIRNDVNNHYKLPEDFLIIPIAYNIDVFGEKEIFEIVEYFADYHYSQKPYSEEAFNELCHRFRLFSEDYNETYRIDFKYNNSCRNCDGIGSVRAAWDDPPRLCPVCEGNNYISYLKLIKGDLTIWNWKQKKQ